MDDNAIIELFFARSEQAIRELDGKYGKVCHSLSYNILHSRQDAEECVNDAYLGTWNAIPPARPSPLRAFFGKITRNLSLDRFRAARAQKRGSGNMELILEELGECVGGGDSVEGAFDARETAGRKDCRRTLPARETRAISCPMWRRVTCQWRLSWHSCRMKTCVV